MQCKTIKMIPRVVCGDNLPTGKFFPAKRKKDDTANSRRNGFICFALLCFAALCIGVRDLVYV